MILRERVEGEGENGFRIKAQEVLEDFRLATLLTLGTRQSPSTKIKYDRCCHCCHCHCHHLHCATFTCAP